MEKLEQFLRLIFFVVVRILVLLLLGLNVRRKSLLPMEGPAIIVANHNSHLDTLVLISLFRLRILPSVHPVADADYFLSNCVFGWFATKIIGIIPIMRGKANKSYDPLKLCCDALDRGNIIILFPEGSRGEPEQPSQFKKGIAHLAERYPDVAVIPVFIHGLGKALPKGDPLFVPFFCDLFIGQPFNFYIDKHHFMQTLNHQFESLANEGNFTLWE